MKWVIMSKEQKCTTQWMKKMSKQQERQQQQQAAIRLITLNNKSADNINR